MIRSGEREASSSRARLLDVVPIAWLDRLLVAALELAALCDGRARGRRVSGERGRGDPPVVRRRRVLRPRARARERHRRASIVKRLPEGMRRADDRRRPDAHLPRSRVRARRRPIAGEHAGSTLAPRVGRSRARSRTAPRRSTSSNARRWCSDARCRARARRPRRSSGPQRRRRRRRAAHDPRRQAGDVRTGRRGRRARAQQPAHVDRRVLRLPHPQGGASSAAATQTTSSGSAASASRPTACFASRASS